MLEFKDLKKQYNMLKNEIDEAIHSVICETNFISGKPIKELEKNWQSMQEQDSAWDAGMVRMR